MLYLGECQLCSPLFVPTTFGMKLLEVFIPKKIILVYITTPTQSHAMRIKTYNNSNNFKHCFIDIVLYFFCEIVYILLNFLQIGELAGLAIGSTIIIDILFAGY